jgi:hypothetical protein
MEQRAPGRLNHTPPRYHRAGINAYNNPRLLFPTALDHNL